MSLFRCLVMAITCIPILASLVIAQEDMSDQVETRIKEVENMIDEELSAIAVLERQQEEAMRADDAQRVAQLKKEIDAANRSLGKLEGLREQLSQLKDSNERKLANQKPRSSRPRDLRNKKRPALPTIGGNESGMDLARENERLRRKQERNASQDPRNDWTDAPLNRGNGQSARSATSRNESFRLRNLRIAHDALLDSGENRLAEQVQALIDREDNGDTSRFQSRDRASRPSTGGMSRGQFSNRSNGPGMADGPGMANGRGMANGPGMADGPSMADGPMSGRRSNQRTSRQPSNNRRPSTNQNRPDSQRELDAMEDEIERLRDKLKALREREGGGD